MRRQVVQPGNDMQRTLRNYIDRLDENGELVEYTKEVNWKYEIGHISRKFLKKSNNPPALLFTEITDYPGCKILTNGLCGFSKYLIALNLNSDYEQNDLSETLKTRLNEPFDPIEVPGRSEAYVYTKEKEVNLLKLPVPWWSQKDAGRYIGTWHINVTRNPESGKRNIGVYRMQMVNSTTTYVSFSPNSDIKKHLDIAESMNQPLQMAVAIGIDERFVIAAASCIRSGVDEYHHAGGLMGEPAELQKCREVGLEVPSDSEIVLEGYIRPHERAPEGPFFDYAGIPKGNPSAAIFDVTTMYYKESPIFRGAAVGVKGGEDHLLYSLLAKAGVLDFHGSRARHMVQNFLLKRRWYKMFQMSGRAKYYLNKKQK